MPIDSISVEVREKTNETFSSKLFLREKSQVKKSKFLPEKLC